MPEVTFKDGGVALLRNLTPEDIPVAEKLRKIARWNQTPRDWKRLISFSPEGCFALELDGELVGTATTTIYAGKVAWIGMMLIDPDVRGKGLGRSLLTTCIDYLQDRRIPSIRLDATPMGEPLYRSLGFEGYQQIFRMRGRTSKSALPEGIRKARPADVAEIARLDKKAFGCDRSPVIQALVEDFPEKTLVACGKNGISGTILGREGARAFQIGPLVSLDNETAELLLRAALGTASGDCVVDVPDGSTTCKAFLEGAGFTVERPFSRMFLGKSAPREKWGMYQIIHCPELG